MHSTQPKTLELSSDEEDIVNVDASNSLKRKGVPDEIIHVDDASSSPRDCNDISRGESVIVDLVESDDDDDSDIVEIIPDTSTSESKRARGTENGGAAESHH